MSKDLLPEIKLRKIKIKVLQPIRPKISHYPIKDNFLHLSLMKLLIPQNLQDKIYLHHLLKMEQIILQAQWKIKDPPTGQNQEIFNKSHYKLIYSQVKHFQIGSQLVQPLKLVIMSLLVDIFLVLFLFCWPLNCSEIKKVPKDS